MKKIITVFIITVVIISSQLFTNCEEKKETVIASMSEPKPLTEAQQNTFNLLKQF